MSMHESEVKTEEQKLPEPTKKQKILLAIRSWLRDVIPAFLIAFILFGVIFRLVIVSGDSMEPALHSGAFLLVQHIRYEPERGDIVVCKPKNYGKEIVKRVIGIGGDIIDIDFNSGAVYVNGEVIEEPYILGSTTINHGTDFPLTVEEGCIFVLGDNRENSYDSRGVKIGQISKDEIIGKRLLTIIK